MTIVFEAPGVILHHGDCIEVMRTLPTASVDAVVTDPPYGLEFMGKEWDGADGFRRSLNEADAGRQNVFGRTSRTSPEYRTASKAPAGMSGTGYTDGGERLERPSFLGGLNPKCLACGKWQRGGNPCACGSPEFTNERLPRLHAFQAWCELWAAEALRVLKPGGHLLAFGGTRTFHRLAAAIEDSGFEIRDSIAWLYGSGFPKSRNLDGDWEGWGTALKPSFEPIVVGRKPLIGTVAANVEAYGTGAMNIDASRIHTPGSEGGKYTVKRLKPGATLNETGGNWRPEGDDARVYEGETKDGRWPTNVVLDTSQAAELDRQAPDTGGSGKASGPSLREPTDGTVAYGARKGLVGEPAFYGDTGGASRFFPTFHYEAKAAQSERPVVDGVAHPTVKPLDLMRWLVRLVTPPNGTILEPFAGSGTTIEAALLEGFNVIGIERAAEYLPLIEARVTKPLQPAMFGDWGAA